MSKTSACTRKIGFSCRQTLDIKDHAERIMLRGKNMKTVKNFGRTLFFIILICLPGSQVWADGGYVSRTESIAISTDQRAIIIKNGNEISMTFSTGYTGEGEDFGWIIPTPAPPNIKDVHEASENVKNAFEILEKDTAPKVIYPGCFPSGTEVLTAGGPRAIETVEPGTKVYTYNLSAGEWILKTVLKRLTHSYQGDIITIRLGQITIRATGNHPFYVLRGDRLALRNIAQDVPKQEQKMNQPGRWVEARDLQEGDVLKGKSGEELIITNLSSQDEKTIVYNLTVEDHHNYAVHQKGILVHNKGKAEAPTAGAPASKSLVTVYGKVTLEHYEVSILGAADALALLNWLQNNDYEVNREAQEILDTYIDLNWAFVAVKLNPSEKRHYENEFLPPLTIKYQSDELIFPLYISSVSTTQTAKIALYVFAESTVASHNFPTRHVRYKQDISEAKDPEKYIENCIQRTVGHKGRRLAVMWSGEFLTQRYPQDTIEELMSELMQTPFPTSQEIYLTRLEARMDPVAMTDDIRFVLDHKPKEFRIRLYPGR